LRFLQIILSSHQLHFILTEDRAGTSFSHRLFERSVWQELVLSDTFRNHQAEQQVARSQVVKNFSITRSSSLSAPARGLFFYENLGAAISDN
jgi:hypothetical protein